MVIYIHFTIDMCPSKSLNHVCNNWQLGTVDSIKTDVYVNRWIAYVLLNETQIAAKRLLET